MKDALFGSRGDTPIRPPLDLELDQGGAPWTERRIARATWAFVGLGVLLRVVRYALEFPLWGDEAFVAVNFIGGGYRALLRPLLYGQICPILFLWAERTSVVLFGFNLLSLRIFSLICGLASLILFRHVAGRVVRGLPWLLSVAILAVSLHPIRHAAEVKPYASDLLAALLLLAPAVEWLRARERAAWVWTLAAIAPLALALSHPAIFVAGGIGLGLALPVWRTGRREVRIAFAVYGVAVVTTFLMIYATFTAPQGRHVMKGLQSYWAASFPPLGRPGAFVSWLVSIHTGTMFAYPDGGRNGASTLTFVGFVGGAVLLWRRGRRALLAVLLGPFALAFLAAAVRRYPYGGEARQMQFVVPMICLLAGLGATALLRAIPAPGPRRRAVGGVLVLLVLGGLRLLVHDVRHPYQYQYDIQARDFAKRFWPDQARQAELLCLRWDRSIFEHRALNLRTAVFLCNQFLYSPHRHRATAVDWHAISPTRPLRCVLYFETRPDHPEVLACLSTLRTTLDFRRAERIDIAMDGATAGPKQENVMVFEFVPKGASQARRAETKSPLEWSRKFGVARSRGEVHAPGPSLKR